MFNGTSKGKFISRKCHSKLIDSYFDFQKGLVLGVYSEKKTNNLTLTPAAKHYNELTGGKLLQSIKL